ncbi:MAG: aminoglycoside phosphotransferase [Deltaproteobacteria bacterium]|nr:aminoglycoside phosphotransferase [Deltaproteobacteria bacterium]
MNPESDFSQAPQLRREILAWGGRTADIRPIAADGSDRRFYRLWRQDGSLICLYHPRPPGEPVTENDSYFAIGRHLRRQGAPVPEIFAYCREEGWFLLQDLGDACLQGEYRQRSAEAGKMALYLQALQVLVHLQVAGTEGFSPDWCFDTPAYDADLVRERECQYCVRAFLQGYFGLRTTEAELSQDFDLLIQRSLYPAENVFLHRDFQSRNLMVHQGRIWVIDFQGARLGPRHYDLAALLLDPYVNLPYMTQETLVAEYLALLREHVPVEAAAWRWRYNHVALCRNLQILGAYGYLSQQRGKPFFRQFIPAALKSLQHRLDLLPGGDFSVLRRVVQEAAEAQ